MVILHDDGISGGTSHGANVINSTPQVQIAVFRQMETRLRLETDGQNLIRATNPDRLKTPWSNPWRKGIQDNTLLS